MTKRYRKDRLRRSMMFVPGNNPGMITDARIYGADSIMFDLEDSVAYTEKDTARFLVHNALRTLDFGKKEVVVRINDLSAVWAFRIWRPLSPPVSMWCACPRPTAPRTSSTASGRSPASRRSTASPWAPPA